MSHEAALQRLMDAGRLDVIVESAFGGRLWGKQAEICRSVAQPHSRTAVPSNNSSGKTYLAAQIGLGFYAAYPDAQVITTSAREDQLRDNLWGEIRSAWATRCIDIPGELPGTGMRLASGDRLLRGLSPARPEGIKGYHSGHVLVIVDEAAFLEEAMAGAIGTLLASGDARLLLIFNPTDSATFAADACESGAYNVIRITAWDTPHFSHLSNEEIHERWGVEGLPEDRVPKHQEVPPGANLITPAYLDDLIATGRGPGTYDWETSVEARFWAQGLDNIVTKEAYDAASSRKGHDGPLVFGIDLAAYGDSESVVAIRRGNVLTELVIRQGLRADQFWQTIVAPLVDSRDPRYVVWDADGPGAGSFTDAYDAAGARALPFRGSFGLSHGYLNMRSLHYWHLHERFDWHDIAIAVTDQELRKQLTAIQYQRRGGKVTIEGKHELRKRGIRRIDRADAVMYAFSTDAPDATRKPRDTDADLVARSADEQAMWERWNRRISTRLTRSRRPARLR